MLRCASKIDHHIYDVDCENPFENDCLFSIIISFIDELTTTLNVEFIEMIFPHDPLKRFNRFKLYLSNGIDEFNYMISMCAYDDFDPNSLDYLFATIIIGLYYGVDSNEYQVVKNLMFDEVFYKQLIDIYDSIDYFISTCNIYKTYTPPIRQLNNQFFKESNDINCYQLKNSCTIGLIGNWATGTFSSIEVIKAIKSFKPDYFIHLGNVYNSGRIGEHIAKLINPIKTYLPNTKTYILPGNHSYFSGSQGIEYALNVFGQNAPYFSLYNKHIQIEGINTTYINTVPIDAIPNVNQNEVEWHHHRVTTAKANGRRIIYLSHHSPTMLYNHFSNTIDDLDFWFYSQDRFFNLMMEYTHDDHIIARPRLIGNGSSTYLRDNPHDVNHENSMNIYPQKYLSMLNPTFVIIKVNNKQLKVRYYQLPQVEMGVYDKPVLLYQEKIKF